MSEFNIGDRIVVKKFVDIPQELRTKGVARLCDKVGTITDKLFSEGKKEYVYGIQFDDFDVPSKKLWSGETLILFKAPPANYYYDFDICDNVVVARLYEEREGVETELEIGHGHIIHEGVKGIAQASAYALKKIYEKLNGGTL